MIVFTVVIMGIILRQFGKKFPMFVGLIIGGAVSNVLDRLFLGSVRDFLPVPFLAVHNNLADWGIFIGLVGIVWSEWWGSNVVTNKAVRDKRTNVV